MNYEEATTIANNRMCQELSQIYLSPIRIQDVTTVSGGTIKTKKISNRTNVPDDAISFSHLVEHHELGFAFRFRAVWRGNRLLQPMATHVAIERMWDEANLGSSTAVSAGINEWLQAVTP